LALLSDLVPEECRKASPATTTERIKFMTERIKTPAVAGILSDVLETLRFRSTLFFRSSLAAPWGLSLEQEPAARFHISLTGSFFLGEIEKDQGSVEVGEMEIVMLPSGQGHWIADRPGRQLTPSKKAGEACELGSPFFQQGSITNMVMCGVSRFDTELTHPLVEAMPSLIHFPRFERNSTTWRLVELISGEAEGSPTLRSTVLDRLTEALFLRLVQDFIEQGDEPIGFVAALKDRSLSQALELLHREPATPWTIDELASRAALSRATLVRRFRESVGMPPIEYLNRWRLLKAHQLARYSAGSIEQIAGQVGFSSAQTLTRAFKRTFGYTPTDLRRTG
jgi:AraC-like DNA-binding protein